MDADLTKKRRESAKSLREKRWSMNSQRLEEIVAELMKPINDVRRSFDTDLSALLEEYLTEAGLRALEENELVNASSSAAANFAELALLLQQSACIYGRKVDFLYQHVLNASESLHNSTQEISTTQSDEPQTPSSRRKRKSAGVGTGGDGEFCPVELVACTSARREGGATGVGARPPPTLPRGYLDLEPRVLHAADAPLLDYAGEPIGLLADFQVTWRLQDGLLVEELQVAGGVEDTGRLRAVPLAELQAAIVAAASPDLPSLTVSPPASPAPLHCSPTPEPDSPPTSLDQSKVPLANSTPLVVGSARRERKRRSDVRLEDVAGLSKMLLSTEMRRKLARVEEFRLPEEWISRVVGTRKECVLTERRRLRQLDLRSAAIAFRGFSITDSTDIGGFVGWSVSEGAQAAGKAGETGAALARRSDRRLDSDDDGFFEQSSTGDSDDSVALQPHLPHIQQHPTSVVETSTGVESAEWMEWREAVVARAAASAARGFSDVRAAGDAVLRAVTTAGCHTDCDTLLTATVDHPTDVSRMFLATLFLANAGNVEIVQGPPLTVNSFSVRLLSADQRLYHSAAAELDR